MMRHGFGGGASALFSPRSGVGQSPPGSIRSWREYLEPMEPPLGARLARTSRLRPSVCASNCRRLHRMSDQEYNPKMLSAKMKLLERFRARAPQPETEAER